MCWKCKNTITESEPISRFAACPVCHADLHSCKNCMYYQKGSHYDCHETVEEEIFDKERANFCSEFKVKRDFSSAYSLSEKQAQAKKAFDALFG